MNDKKFRFQILSCLLLFLLLAGNTTFSLSAQNEQKPEKQKARISLDFFNINNKEQKLVTTVKTRVEGFYQNVPGVEIRFFRTDTSEELLLGSSETDENGKASITIPAKSDTSLWSTYLAVLENNPNFRDADKEIEVKKGHIQMELEEVDSVKMVKIMVLAPDSAGHLNPVEECEARVYVKRLFGLLPVSDEFGVTDEEGVLNIEFPADIPGDESGNIEIIARVSDHDEFGNLEFREQIAWGIPLELDQSELDRELWLSSSNTPNIFLVVVNSMLLCVFVVIVYIIFQLFQISKAGLEG